MGDTSAHQLTPQKLDSWKEIAAFFDRDERTVRRWEKERALPVHRVPGGGRGGVYAYPSELKDWLKGRASDLDRAVSESAPATALPLERRTGGIHRQGQATALAIRIVRSASSRP